MGINIQKINTVYLIYSKTKIFKRFMWSRTAGLISKGIEKSSSRNYAYFAGHIKKQKVEEMENHKAEGKLTSSEENELKTIKEIDTAGKNHPIVVKPTSENNWNFYGYLTHAPKAPKSEGEKQYIEISNPTDSEPQFININKTQKLNSNSIKISHEIAADNSPAEAIIDKEIKKHEKI